jgi:hypothetical protein
MAAAGRLCYPDGMHRHPAAWSARNSLIARLAAAATLLPGVGVASASLVEIAWDEQGKFQHSSQLEAGGFAEVCGPLSAREQVHWAFEASAALDFNIHYHVGDEVLYPAASPDTVELADVLIAPADQTYCWMWTNSQPSPVNVTLRLLRD